MEIIVWKKQTLTNWLSVSVRSREKVTGICSQTKDAALKKWMDNQEVCGILLNIQENTSGHIAERTVAFHPDQEQVLL